jgi:hypothetical protein
MFEKTMLRWLLQPSTVIGLGMLAGSICYFLTGDPTWAGIAAGAVKILVSDNSTGAGEVFEAITVLARALGRPLPSLSQRVRVVSGDRGSNAGSLEQEATETMTNDWFHSHVSLAGY